MKTATIHQAKTHLSRLIREASNGEDVVILNGQKPVARLVPYTRRRAKRPRVGAATSAKFWLAPNAFDPLTDEELKEWGL